MQQPQQLTSFGLAPVDLASITVQWSGAERMLARVRGMVVSAGSNPQTAGNFARIAYNLPLLLAFDAMRGALLAARDAGHFACGNDNLGPLMDAEKNALPWIDWQALRDGVRRRNRVAHDGELHSADQCIQAVQQVEEQLAAWGII
jgi:hypothetical protein